MPQEQETRGKDNIVLKFIDIFLKNRSNPGTERKFGIHYESSNTDNLLKDLKDFYSQSTKAEVVKELKNFANKIKEDVKNGVQYNIKHEQCKENNRCNLTDIQINAYLDYWINQRIQEIEKE